MRLVLTAIGDERTGLVAALSDAIASHGGSWLESQMAVLAGKFAGIVLVEIPEGHRPALADSLSLLEGFDVSINEIGPMTEDEEPAGGILVIRLIGQDRPGIVRDVSAALCAWGVTIEELVTSTREAPMGDGQLFEADAVVTLPEETSADDVIAVLEGLAGDLVVDIDVDVVAN